MDWRTMLVSADGSPQGIARALIAKEICLTNADGVLEVQVPVQRPMRPYGFGSPMLMDEYATAVEGLKRAAELQASPLRDALKDMGDRAHISILDIDPDDASRVCAARGRTADVCVLGQPTAHASSLERALVKGALMGSGRPCLILPNWEAPRRIDGRAVIAWKGTPESARAVRDSLPLLRKAERVRVFCASSDNEIDGEGPHGLARLTHYLERHGVRIEPIVATAPPDDITSTVGDAIKEEALSYGADLLVMGGFGHSRWSEIVFGGATQNILQNANCAILMSH